MILDTKDFATFGNFKFSLSLSLPQAYSFQS